MYPSPYGGGGGGRQQPIYSYDPYIPQPIVSHRVAAGPGLREYAPPHLPPQPIVPTPAERYYALPPARVYYDPQPSFQPPPPPPQPTRVPGNYVEVPVDSTVQVGDCFRVAAVHKTPGGGGYGPPAQPRQAPRDPYDYTYGRGGAGGPGAGAGGYRVRYY